MKKHIQYGLTAPSRQNEQGFTLVELAIVLVIIGLIIGGILVGQDMIKSAEIRATIGQWEKFNAATNTFRDKYGYLPGDINQTRALEYGLYDRTAVAAAGNGDGNGLLQACAQTAAASILLGCETAGYWQDLNTVGMVDGAFTNNSTAVATVATAAIDSWMPKASLGRGNVWTVFSDQGRNWFQLTGVVSTAAGVYTLAEALTPNEAFNIDRKTDDGRPHLGGTRAMDGTGPLNTAAAAAAAAAGVCNATGNVYNQGTEAFANTPACQLRLRMM